MRTTIVVVFGGAEFLRATVFVVFGEAEFLRTTIFVVFGEAEFLRTTIFVVFGRAEFLRTTIFVVFGGGEFLRATIFVVFGAGLPGCFGVILGSLSPLGCLAALVSFWVGFVFWAAFVACSWWGGLRGENLRFSGNCLLTTQLTGGGGN